MTNKQFADALKSLRLKFNLTQRQIANIAEIPQTDYSTFERCKRKLGLDDANNLSSKVWGIRYNDFVEFSSQNINIEKLPILTQKAIENSKDFLLKDTENILAIELDRLINKGELNSPKTSKILHSMMKKKLQKKSSTEITNLLNKKPRSEIIIKLKIRFKGQNIYVHKEFLKEFKKLSIEDIVKMLE